MDLLGVEPFVIDALQVTSLFQSGILVIYSVDNIQLIADYAQLCSRDFGYLVVGYTVKSQLFNLILQWLLSP